MAISTLSTGLPNIQYKTSGSAKLEHVSFVYRLCRDYPKHELTSQYRLYIEVIDTSQGVPASVYGIWIKNQINRLTRKKSEIYYCRQR